MSNEHIADEFKDQDGNPIGGGGGGGARVAHVTGRRYTSFPRVPLFASDFTMVADRLYAFFFPIPESKTYSKISAMFGPDGASFSAGSQARLGAYEHDAGKPGDLIADGLITDAILTGNSDVDAEITLAVPATTPGIFLAVMADRALKIQGTQPMEADGGQILDTLVTPGASPVVGSVAVGFMTQRDLGAFGTLPDPFGVGTVQFDSTFAAPNIMLRV